MKLLFGNGYNDRKYQVFKNKRPTREYDLWHSMLKRCYDKKTHLVRPTYKNTEMSEKFKSYTYFHEWCQEQIGFSNTNFSMDKDLITKGNKIYSEDSCLFVPYDINGCLTKADDVRGDYPIGVHFSVRNKINPYKAEISIRKKKISLGYYDCPIKAFNAYKIAKERHIKDLAERYRHCIDPKAYLALMNYSVEITD